MGLAHFHLTQAHTGSCPLLMASVIQVPSTCPPPLYPLNSNHPFREH